MVKKNAKTELLDYGLNTAKLTQFSVEEFFDESLRLYSAHSNVRGIPFIGDGFKEAQRKAMWGMLERGEAAALISVERVSASCAACFTGDTPITLSTGQQVLLGELVHQFQNSTEDFFIRAFDEEKQEFVSAEVENAFLTKYTTELLEITLENGEAIRVTPEHPFFTARGWVEAQFLSEDDEIISDAVTE